MERRRRLIEGISGTAIILLSLLFQLLALLQFRLERKSLLLESRWEPQFYLLILLSIIFSLLLPLQKRDSRGFAVLIFLKLTVLILIGVPLGSYIGVELSMLISLTLELIYFLAPPASYILAFLIILVDGILQLPFLVWEGSVPAASLHDRLSLLAYALVVLVLTGVFRELALRLAAARSRIAELDRAIFQLSNANVGFQSYADREVARSREGERNRITREIHDSIGYCLTNVTMLMEAGIKLCPLDQQELQEIMTDAREEAKEGLAETRRSLRLLRERGERRLQGIPSILRLTRAFERATGVEVTVESGQAPMRFPDLIDLPLYRFVQEGLTNALKHGKAKRVHVQFQQSGEGLSVHIRDNGVGATEIKKGIGFLGMEERIERVGGRVEMVRSDDGFTVSAWIPLTVEGGPEE